MCQNVPPLELYDDELFNLLPRTWQNAVARMCVRLHKRGDGNLSDEWLMKKLFTDRKRLPEFRAVIIELGYFRDVEGNLHRAGMCAPSAAAAEEEHPARSAAAEAVANTRAMQLNARVTQLEKALGLAAPATQTPRESFTNGSASPNKSPSVDAQTSLTNRTGPAQTANTNDPSRAAESDSESDTDPILLFTKGESDSDSESEARALLSEIGMETVFDALIGENFGVEIVYEVITTAYDHFQKIKEKRKPAAIVNYCRSGCERLRDRLAAQAAADKKRPPRLDMLEGMVKGGRANESAAAQSPPGRSARPAPLTPEEQDATLEALKTMRAEKKAELAPVHAAR